MTSDCHIAPVMYIRYIRQFSQEKLAALAETLMKNWHYHQQIHYQMYLQLIYLKFCIPQVHALMMNGE